MKIQFVLCYSHIFCKQLLVARTGFPLPFLPRIWVTTFLAVCSCTLILPTPHLFWNWRCRQNIPSKYSNALIRLHLVTNHNTVCKPYRHAYQKSEISHNVLERQVVARTVTDFPYFMEKAKFRYRVHNSPPLVRIKTSCYHLRSRNILLPFLTLYGPCTGIYVRNKNQQVHSLS